MERLSENVPGVAWFITVAENVNPKAGRNSTGNKINLNYLK